MNKKGELLSQPFIYIFMIIVIGLVVILGFTNLKNLIGFGCTVESEKLMHDFKNNVKQMYGFSSGSKQKYSFTTPSGINGICFVDSTMSPDLAKITYKDIQDYVAIKSSAGDLNENIFFSGSDEECLPEPNKIDKLKVQGNTLCFNVAKGKFDYVLENKGTFVEISKP